MSVDTLVCGDTLAAYYDPIQGGQATDSFYVWLGNCQEVVRFDFTTADIPDGADIFYMDLAGNLTSAGSMPYFGGNCSGANYFTNPVMFPPITTLDPLNCLPGFVEIYGRGIPIEDSIKRRLSLPSDFMLSGTYQESARLHLDIPPGIVAVLFVVKYNPTAFTVLNAIWDCTPECCIAAIGDTVCAGDSVFLDTDREALSYQWSGPNGFHSTSKSPVIPAASVSNEGWYVVEGMYLFGCSGKDSVYVSVQAPTVSVNPGNSSLCLGDSVLLSANGGSSYQWMSASGMLPGSGNHLWVSPTDTTMITVIGTDPQGCSDSAYAMIGLQELDVQFQSADPSCHSGTDGMITASLQTGQAPFEVRLAGQSWQSGLSLNGLAAATYTVEVRDASGCLSSETISLQNPLAMTLSPTHSDPSCHGLTDGALSISVNQGMAPFEIREAGGSWQSGTSLQGIGAGSYQIDIRDQQGCISSTHINLNEPQPLMTHAQHIDPSCANTCDGSILLSASGGMAPYQFRMGGAATDSLEASFCEGKYAVEVIDAHGCLWADSVVLHTPEAVQATISTTLPSCPGHCDGELTLSSTGGLSPYRYFVEGTETSAHIQNLCAGRYLIEVVDANDCPWSTEVDIEDPAPFQMEVSVESISCVASCDGQIRFLPPPAQGPYSYFVNEVASDPHMDNLCAGSYRLKVVNSEGCSWDSTLVLEDPAPLTATVHTQDPGCNKQCDGILDMQVQGGTSPYQYVVKGAPQAGPMADGFCSGVYPVLIEDANGCQWTTQVELHEPELFEVMVASSPTSCQSACDGEAAFMPIGGQAPFHYWVDTSQVDSVIDQLCATDHVVEVSDAGGCRVQLPFTIEEGEAFVVDLGEDQHISEGEELTVRLHSSHALQSILWEGICEQNCKETIRYSPNDTEILYVQASSEGGCLARDSLLIGVYREIDCNDNIYMPNAFTPNGDGINDQFTLYANTEADIELINKLVIFNQWGKVVFDRSALHPGNLSEGWDGFKTGTASPEGTYSWIASFRRRNGQVLECSGSIVLIR
ncbi:MAG: gliding motility-associated C-terminal domain-containing protein [Bacteroidota bacterium]